MKDKNKNQALTGGAAVAEALRQINPDVMAAYPITPQTPIIETFAKMQAECQVDTEIIPVESEHSAMSACVGSVAAGARTVTATSSQGLALMHEMLYIASGLRLPIFMVVSARALSAPINIHGDHSDVMGARDTGWIQLFSENVQEIYDNTLIGLKLAEAANLPVMAIMDGFITSHSVENLEILPDEKAQKFVGAKKMKAVLLDLENPVTLGALSLPDSYFEFKVSQAKAMEEAKDIYQKIASDFQTLTLRYHGLFEAYQLKDAEQIIIVAGSVAGTAKVVVDKLRSEGKKVGLLKIKMFRPFPHAAIAEALKNVKSIAVLDRAMSFGTNPPIFSEILNSCQMVKVNCQMSSYVYGLGGRDIFQKDIEKVFADLIKGDVYNGIKYIVNNNF